MIDKLDEVDRRLINTIQLDFPLNSRPFLALGDQIGISETDVIDHLKRLTDVGIAMRVSDDAIDEVAAQINEFDEVSHNYLRPGSYNMWFTVSARSEERLREMIREIDALGHPFLDLPVERLFKIGVRFEV